MNGGENMHLFMLRYNHGNFTAGAGIMLPFSPKYKREEESEPVCFLQHAGAFDICLQDAIADSP
ncbi:MAG: hypothetical protein V8T12_09500 [Parabacteroides johnsonii]